MTRTVSVDAAGLGEIDEEMGDWFDGLIIWEKVAVLELDNFVWPWRCSVVYLSDVALFCDCTINKSFHKFSKFLAITQGPSSQHHDLRSNNLIGLFCSRIGMTGAIGILWHIFNHNKLITDGKFPRVIDAGSCVHGLGEVGKCQVDEFVLIVVDMFGHDDKGSLVLIAYS